MCLFYSSTWILQSYYSFILDDMFRYKNYNILLYTIFLLIFPIFYKTKRHTFSQTKRKFETLRTPSFDFHIFDFITCISYWFTVPPRHRGVKPKTSSTSRLRRCKDFVKPQIGLTFHPLYVTLVDSQFNARKYRIYRATQ